MSKEFKSTLKPNGLSPAELRKNSIPAPSIINDSPKIDIVAQLVPKQEQASTSESETAFEESQKIEQIHNKPQAPDEKSEPENPQEKEKNFDKPQDSGKKQEPEIDLKTLDLIASAMVAQIGKGYNITFTDQSKLALAKLEAFFSMAAGKVPDRVYLLNLMIRLGEYFVRRKDIQTRLVNELNCFKEGEKVTSTDVENVVDKIIKETKLN